MTFIVNCTAVVDDDDDDDQGYFCIEGPKTDCIHFTMTQAVNHCIYGGGYPLLQYLLIGFVKIL